MRTFACCALAGAFVACGASRPQTESPPAPSHDPEVRFGPLEVGSDHRTAFEKLNKTPWISRTRGRRFVNTYAHAIAMPVYMAGGADLPVGSIDVKESFETENDAPGVAGPIFVMDKRAAGYDPPHGDLVIRGWERPTGANAAGLRA